MVKRVEDFMDMVIQKNPGEEEFHQAVREVVDLYSPLLKRTPNTRKVKYWRE